MATVINMTRSVAFHNGQRVHKMAINIMTGPNSRLTDTVMEDTFKRLLDIAEEAEATLPSGYDENGMYTLPEVEQAPPVATTKMNLSKGRR